MKTLFLQTPFGTREGPSVPVPRTALGQLPGLLQDILQLARDLGGKVAGLLDDLPSEALGVYKPRYDECLKTMESNPYEGYRCLEKLYEDIRSGKGLPEPGAAPPPPPPESKFPIVPVAIGAAALVAVALLMTAD